jgi:hypothetical protein
MFEKIKVGDEVLRSTSVRYGWNQGKTFYIKKNVDRITKTQFCIGNVRYRKDSGAGIGSRSECYPIGYERCNKPLEDQTEEYMKFIAYVSAYNKCSNSLFALGRKCITMHFNVDDLSKIDKFATEIINVIDSYSTNDPQ